MVVLYEHVFCNTLDRQGQFSLHILLAPSWPFNTTIKWNAIHQDESQVVQQHWQHANSNPTAFYYPLTFMKILKTRNKKILSFITLSSFHTQIASKSSSTKVEKRNEKLKREVVSYFHKSLMYRNRATNRARPQIEVATASIILVLFVTLFC